MDISQRTRSKRKSASDQGWTPAASSEYPVNQKEDYVK